jgi:two-component sensor histidine kinase
MIRKIILMMLMAQGALPCLCQVMPLRSEQEIRNQLKMPQTDTSKASLLLDLALSNVLKPGEYAEDLDSAISLIQEAEAINAHAHNKGIEAKTYFVYSNALRESGKNDLGKQYILKALAIYDTINEPNAKGEAFFELSSYYSIYDGMDAANQKRECFAKALPLFRTAGNEERQADALKNMGDIDQYMDNFPAAMKELQEALAIYRSIGYRNLQGVYDLMGSISYIKGDYPDAARYGLQAVKTAEEVNDTTIQLCTIYNRLGLAYARWSKYEQAATYSQRALDIALKYNDKTSAEIVLFNLCNQLGTLNRWQEAVQYAQRVEGSMKGQWDCNDSLYVNASYALAYVLPKKYDRASKYIDQIVEQLKSCQDNLPVQKYRLLAMYFLGTQQYATAERYTDIFLAQAISQGNYNARRTAYELKSQIDSAKGDLGSALYNYKLYKKLSDSQLNEAASFQFAQMEVEHETEKKDNDIKILQQREQIQQAQLLHSRTMNTVVILGISLLALLLVLLSNRYRIKQRHNRELETKQKEINEKNTALNELVIEKDELIDDKDVLLKEKDWLVKEIHHRVNNNLQIIISLLNTQSEFLNHPSALDAIRESRERMQAIAILHQRLYQLDNSSQVNMRSYINELVDNIKGSMSDTDRIHFHVDVADVNLDMSQSVPLGLILNEAITNSIKYAYAKNERGIVRISLQKENEEQLQLIIEDHGRGLPSDLQMRQDKTLGLQLIKLFSEQLEGDLYFINENGLKITLRFKIQEPKQSYSEKTIV